jgi:hypothetical protein
LQYFFRQLILGALNDTCDDRIAAANRQTDVKRTLSTRVLPLHAPSLPTTSAAGLYGDTH